MTKRGLVLAFLLVAAVVVLYIVLVIGPQLAAMK